MKTIAALTCLLFSFNSYSAQAPRLRDEVSKIAVGPKPVLKATPAPAPTEDEITPTEADAAASDAVDNVDKPIKKPTVLSTDAPHEAAPPSVRDEGTIPDQVEETPTPHSEPEATAKIDTAKPKAEILKPKGAAPEPVRVEKAHAAEPPAAAAKHVEGVSAEQSLKWLENGNIRYVSRKFRADGRGEKERAKKEVKPHAIILSCSDSRVPPELIFDQGLGEITTIRVAAEVPDASVIASIEQSIVNEHPHLLVVLGHTQCSSIEAALSWKDTPSFGSDALDRMVSEIKPHFKTLGPGERSPGFQVEAALQADGVARSLTEHSAIIRKAVESGELTIKTGLYWVDTGKVKFY